MWRLGRLVSLSHTLCPMPRTAQEGAALLGRAFGALRCRRSSIRRPCVGWLGVRGPYALLRLGSGSRGLDGKCASGGAGASPAAGLSVRGKWRRLVGPVKTQPGELRLQRRQVAGTPGPAAAGSWITPLGGPRQGALRPADTGDMRLPATALQQTSEPPSARLPPRVVEHDISVARSGWCSEGSSYRIRWGFRLLCMFDSPSALRLESRFPPGLRTACRGARLPVPGRSTR